MATRWPEPDPRRTVSVLPDSFPTDSEELFTGVSCPDCSGTLTLRTHGRLVTFVCRIGHMYSAVELLATKEEILERRLWIAFSALDELALLLEDFRRQGLEPADSDPQRRRSAMAREQAVKLRAIIEMDRPLIPKAADERPLGEAP